MGTGSQLAQVQRLPDTDADGRKSLGMTCLLLSSTMAFGGLLVLYGLLRRDAPEWPPPGGRVLPLGLASAASLAIACSSIALHTGVRAVVRARPRQLLPALVATLALGAAFLALELVLWLQLWGSGFVFGNRHAGAFYTLTGFHFAHVLLALGLLLWLVPGARRERYHANDHVRVRLVARFWHFLGINWALLFLAFFVWQR
jgi:heme/copper-type cytochrome/quinol oxidase subunit 3